MASKSTPDTGIDVSKLKIVDEPYVDGRSMTVSKYDAFFATVQPEKRIVCPTGRAGGLGSQLRKWLERQGHTKPIVKSRERCADGNGGVWWIKAQEKPKTVWAGLKKAA